MNMTRQSFRTTLQQKVIKTLKWEEKNENESQYEYVKYAHAIKRMKILKDHWR